MFQTKENSDVLSVSAQPISIEVTSDVAHREVFPGADASLQPTDSLRASTFNCPDANKLNTLRNSQTDARNLARAAASRIRNNQNNDQYTKFFGTNDRNEVARRYDLIANDAGTRT